MNDQPNNLPQKMGEMRSGGAIKAIVPQTMDDAFRLAKAVCVSGLAPEGLKTPEAAMIAIMHGMEVGLTPMMALQKIAVINGRPTLWGDGALGLVRGSGLCEYVKEWMEGEGDERVAWCETKRRGEAEPIRRSFSVKEAQAASLWSKAIWKNYPLRMLQMRARGFAIRDGYADVLGGMYIAEELQGQEMRDITLQETNTAGPPPPPPPPADQKPPPPPPAKPAARGPREPVEPHDPEQKAAFDMQRPHDLGAGEVIDVDPNPMTGQPVTETKSDAPAISKEEARSQHYENYAAKVADWHDRLKAASDEEQGEIWDTEIQPWIEDGDLMPPDQDKLKGLLRNTG